MRNPTTASTTEAVFPAISADSCSKILHWCTLPKLMGIFVLAFMLASCMSNSNNTGGSASGGATSSGGTSAGAAGSQTSTGAGGSNHVPGTGGASGGATGTSSGSGGTSVSAGGSSGSGGSIGGGGGAGGGIGGRSNSAGSGAIAGSGAGGATTASGGATKSGDGGAGGSSTTGGGGRGLGVDASVGAGGGGGSTDHSSGGGGSSGSGGAGGGSATGDAENGAFALTSPDLADGAHFDAKFTCASTAGTVGQLGNGVNPELDWSGAPASTMSFAITFIDTTLGDTNPMGQHWAIWNIPATVTKFPQATATLTGDLATAKQSGKFLSPCAQSLTNNMDDQYAFTLYALSTATLNITGTTVANALTALKAITPLGTATLHGHAGLKGK